MDGTRRVKCENCRLAEYCLRRLRALSPIFECEDFEPVCSLPRENQVFELSGLCVSCKRKHRCDKCHVEGGVWHCADFE